MDSGVVQPTPETIGRLCLKKFEDLPKTGKPTSTQWTVLAGIVLHNSTDNSSKVVSLGLGTKCIGSSKMCKNGWILNDSHAEVLARRGLLRYIYHQINCVNKNNNSTPITLWDADKGKYRVKPEYSFHFFSTQTPCGDACIIDKNEDIDSSLIKRRKLSNVLEENIENNVGSALMNSAIYTGAKLFGGDGISNDHMAQTLGALRIKPGKGDRTLSMSCSDKLSKWCILGVQGALIDILLEKPLCFTTMTFCQGTNLHSIQRALHGRWQKKTTNFVCNNFRFYEPKLQICDDSVTFECCQTKTRNQPCPNGLVWCDLSENFKPCEIVVNGKRQGCTKKVLKTAESALKISKYHLLQEFINVLRGNDELRAKFQITQQDMGTLKYTDAKNLAKSYQDTWNLLKTEVFGLWTKKPADLIQFSLNIVSEML